MQQILSKHARFVQQSTVKMQAKYQLTTSNLPFIQQTRPMHIYSFITPTTQHYFSQKKPDQNESKNSENHRPSGTYRQYFKDINNMLSRYFLKDTQEGDAQECSKCKKQSQSSKFISKIKNLLLAIFAVATAFLVQLQHALFTEIYQYVKRKLRDNKEISKGKTVQKKILEDLEAEYKKQQHISNDYMKELSYYQELENIIRTRDIQILNVVESFTGNEFGPNLKRMINERMHIRPPIFQKFYYLNLKNPPAYQLSRSQEGRDWHEAKELHYLLNALIGTKRTSEKPNILVIDEVQVLEHFFDDKEKQEMLNDILRQIFELQKIRNTKVICIGNSQTFSERLSNLLSNNGKLKLTKSYLIGRLDQYDVSTLVRSKVGQKGRMEQQHNALLASQNDVFFSYNPFYTEQYEYIHQDQTISNLEITQGQNSEKTLSQQQISYYNASLQLIEEKCYYILKVINSRISNHYLPNQNGNNNILFDQTKLAKVKFQLLRKVYANGFGNGEDRMHFSDLQKKLNVELNDKYQQKAYIDLNRDGVLHGLVFVNKATFLAFHQIIQASRQSNRF